MIALLQIRNPNTPLRCCSVGTVVKKSVLADVFASEFSCFVFEHYCGCVHPSMSLLISVVLVFDFFVMVVVVCCTFVAHLIVSASTRLLCQIQFTLGGWSSGSQSYLPSLTQAFSNPDNICQKIFLMNWPCPSGTPFFFSPSNLRKDHAATD